MNKIDNSKMAVKELETTQSIEILEGKEEEQEYRNILARHGNTKSELIKELQKREYSEFMIGCMIGLILATEGKKAAKRDWRPSFLRKWNK